MRIYFLLLCLFFTLNGRSQDTIHPNIMLIISEGHGYNDIGIYGNIIVKTPFLDDLAKNGIKMINTFGASACYDANMAALFTGLYGHASGQYGPSGGNNHFSVFPETESLPQILKKSGYNTALCGKIILEGNKAFSFDTIIGSDIIERSVYEQTERCAPFILKKDAKPFFLCFNMNDPDRSYSYSDEDSAKVDIFGNIDEGYSGILQKHYKPEKVIIPSFLPDIAGCRNEIAQYYEAITRMDLGIGRLIYWLKKSGKWNNTLIVYVSADVPAFPGIRNTFSDQGIRLPCIIKLADNTNSGVDCMKFTSLIDLLPTILDYSKVPFPKDKIHGKSLRLNIEQKQEYYDDEIFVSQSFTDITLYYPMRMIRTKQYKLIWNCVWQLTYPMSNALKSSSTWNGILNYHKSIGGKQFETFFHKPEFELYDIKSDPNESVNLIFDKGNEAIINKLKAIIEGYMISTGDPWITRWNNK